MDTKIIKIIDDFNDLEICKDVIQDGGLVAFPTETVYGLGANALDERAIKKIYAAKGRPSDNPLIVHIADIDMLDELVLEVNEVGKKLIDAFWPGPLTLIFKKKNIIPNATSGGLDTVGIRMPQNLVARKFIEKCNLPIAAPSANTSGRPSTTRASHVKDDLYGKIDVIIDYTECDFGIESTIVDTTRDVPVLLRPGSVTVEDLEKVVGKIKIDENIINPDSDVKPIAPGMKYRHYAPNGKVTIVDGASKVDNILNLIKDTKGKIAILSTSENLKSYEDLDAVLFDLGSINNKNDIAKNLFDVLRKCDDMQIDNIFCEGVGNSDLSFSIMNRLLKAASYNIIYVD